MDLFSYRTWILFEIFISQQLLFLLLTVGLLFIGSFVSLYLWFLILYQRCGWKRFSPILCISSSLNLQYVYLYCSFIVLCDSRCWFLAFIPRQTEYILKVLKFFPKLNINRKIIPKLSLWNYYQSNTQSDKGCTTKKENYMLYTYKSD